MNLIKFSIDINKKDKNGVIKKYSGFPKDWQNLSKSNLNKNKNGEAILTGKVNNIIVIDFDKEEGMYYFNKYKKLFEDTFIEDSTNGYKHAYFIYDDALKSGVSNLSNKIDILSDGKCCVIGKTNNDNQIQKINSHFKYLLLNGEDDDINSNVSTQYETESDTSTHSDINFDNHKELCEMLDLLPESYYNNYNTWTQCGMIINNITNTHGFKIWEHFSKVKNYKKFIKNSEYQMISLWNKFEVKKGYEMDIFFNYIIDTENEELIKKLDHFKVKYNYTITKNDTIYNYFEEDDFYFNDISNHLVSKTFKSYNDILIYLRDNLHRAFAMINDDLVIKKTNEDDFYNLMPFEKSGLKLIRIKYIQKNKTKKITLYDIILDNKQLFHIFNNFKCNFDYTYKNKQCFYMSRRFKAKQLETYDLSIIQELLDFIKEIYCNNEDKLYDYFMKWLSFIVKYPNIKSNKGIVLYSKEQGCGKGTFTNFLCEYIFGQYNTIPNAQGLKSILGNNNYHMLGKKFINVNELSSIKDEFRNNFDALKSLITDKDIQIKKLYCDIFTAEQLTEFIFCTNNKYSFHIEEHDRRYLLLEVSGKYHKDQEYLIKLNRCIRNQNYADHFYTYLLTLLDKPDEFLTLKVPTTKYKEDIVNTSKHNIKDYIDFLLGENLEYYKNNPNKTSWTSEELDTYINYDEPDKGRYRTSNLYKHYVKWLELNGERKQSNRWFRSNLLDNGFKVIKTGGYEYYYSESV